MHIVKNSDNEFAVVSCGYIVKRNLPTMAEATAFAAKIHHGLLTDAEQKEVDTTYMESISAAIQAKKQA